VKIFDCRRRKKILFLLSKFKINPLNPQDEQSKNGDREITITGTPEAQWKSQYYIYDKLRQDGRI